MQAAFSVAPLEQQSPTFFGTGDRFSMGGVGGTGGGAQASFTGSLVPHTPRAAASPQPRAWGPLLSAWFPSSGATYYQNLPPDLPWNSASLLQRIMGYVSCKAPREQLPPFSSNR